jgi:Flp pilus assembly protein TadG
MIPLLNACCPYLSVSRVRWPAVSRVALRSVLRGDRGSASVELALATVALLLILLGIVQFALWSHATHVAQAAASQGLAAARAQNGTAAAGTASAQQLLDQLGQGPLTNPSVTSNRSNESASVRIAGTASSVIPFLSLPVHAEAVGPVERFVPQSYGFTNSEAVSGGNPSAGGTR